jgi:DamX protein
MAEHEPIPYRMNKKRTIDYSLITQERFAKLELFIHLLSNSSRPIVLCGSKGVGKSTLLSVFQQRQDESSQTLLIQGSVELSVEQIQNQLNESYSLEQATAQQKKIILIIDDAGLLAPQLINAIIDYAATYSVLKVVFVLSHDDLSIKTHSDSAIEDCHIIEMPPLSESQCGDFLQHLAIKSVFEVPANGITETMVASIYQQTHGIPAKILEQLPSLNQSQKTRKPALWLVVVLCVLGITAIAYRLFDGS